MSKAFNKYQNEMKKIQKNVNKKTKEKHSIKEDKKSSYNLLDCLDALEQEVCEVDLQKYEQWLKEQ